MTDIFDGGLYKDVKYLFESEMTIGLGLYTDDYQQFQSNKHSMTIVHLTVLNINPKHWMENQLMLQVAILPRPNKLQDMSIFRPLLGGLEQLCKNGIIVETETGPLRVHAHLLFYGSDILAVAKMAGHSSHTHYYRCRFCLIRDEFMLNWMTFPPKPTSRTHKIEYFKEQKTAEAKAKNKERGQTNASIFACLPTFYGATFFPNDLMHLLLGIGKQLWRIIIGEYGKGGNPLYLPPKMCREFGERIANLRKLSTDFAGDYGNISSHSGFYWSIDWIHFVLYLVSSLLLEYYTDESTCDALINLAMAFKYIYS